jgi:hypothetical protein
VLPSIGVIRRPKARKVRFAHAPLDLSIDSAEPDYDPAWSEGTQPSNIVSPKR